MRMRNKPWMFREMDGNPRLVHNPAEHKGNWNAFFGNNDQPLHVELGCGKGKFINGMALINPGINYVAVEREIKVLAAAMRLSRGLDCAPAFINCDVTEISEIFAPGEIQRIYINFCDPWPNKNKWAKRRLTYSGFLDIYAGLFGHTSGEVFFKTDNKELFEFSVKEFTRSKWRLENITEDLHNSGYEGNVTTEYEEKFSLMGMPIYRLEAYYSKANI